jgi:hypothetical protein
MTSAINKELCLSYIHLYIQKDTKTHDMSSFENIESMLNNKQIILLDLISIMEPYLTSIDSKIRYKGGILISKLMESFSLNSVTLSAAELHHFIIFFISRCNDYPSLIPSLQSLIYIIKYYSQCIDPKYCDVMDIFRYHFFFFSHFIF